MTTIEINGRLLPDAEFLFESKVGSRDNVIMAGARTLPGKEIAFRDKPVAIGVGEADAYHTNLVTYLECCWSSHHGIVITPDMIWFHILSEVSNHIRDNAETYRDKFTTSAEGKTEIEMLADGSETIINLNSLVVRLKKLVPSDVSLFLPEFTTTTPMSRLAVASVFCEAMTPYYSYSVCLCGIPKVMVLGSVEDWEKIAVACEDVAGIVSGAAGYLKNTAIIARDIASQVENGLDKNFWSGIFSLKACGSGHQVEVDGWINRLYMAGKPCLAFSSNYPTHVTKVPFDLKGSPGGDVLGKFTLTCGLLNSVVKDGFLVPDFGWVLLHEQEFPLSVKEARGIVASLLSVDEDYGIAATVDDEPRFLPADIGI